MTDHLWTAPLPPRSETGGALITPDGSRLCGRPISRRRSLVFGVLGAALPFISGSGRAQPARIVLGTATQGGGFQVYGKAVVDALRTVDPELAIEDRRTPGSTENIKLAESGAIDLGLVTGEVLHEALSGIGRPRATVKVLSAIYSQPGMFAVRADSAAHTIGDLRGKPVAFGAASSGLVVLARYVLDGMGLNMERDFKAILLEQAGDGPGMVRDGRAAALWGAGVGWPGFVAVADAPGGARFIVPSAAEVDAILAKHAFLKPLTIPAGAYPGVEAPLQSVGSWSFIVTKPGFDDATAYRLARALHRAEAALGQALPRARETTAANTVAAVAAPDLLHPGAARYLREAGVLR